MTKICPPGKIVNPKTNRCVKIDSAIGKKLLKNVPINIDSLKTIKVIGRGGFGETVLIQDTDTGKKYIRKESINNRQDDMRHQYKMLHELETKNICEKNFICPVIKYRDKNNRYFIVFDYLENYETLDKVNLQNSPTLTIKQKKTKISKKIIKLVELLHKNNIVHVDIKPQNIMVNPKTLDVRLIDFGTALVFEKSSTKFYRLRGYTTSYISPNLDKSGFNNYKQLLGNDMWALGITLCSFLFNYPTKSSEVGSISTAKYLDDTLRKTLKVKTTFFLKEYK